MGAASLLWVALLNGYPVVFSDTGEYLESAIERFAAPIHRPFGYGWFIFLSSLNISPWLTTICQAVIAATLLAFFVKLVNIENQRLVYSVVLATTALLSSAPYFTGQLMPDFFSGLLPLVLYMLIAYYEQVSWPQRFGLLAFLGVAVASHTSNVVIVPVTAMACVFLLLFFGRKVTTKENQRAWIKGAALSLGTAMLAALAICVSNLRTHGEFVISPVAHAFLLARLVADGPAADYLRRVCPQADYQLCAEVRTLPRNSDTFLYATDALDGMGGWLDSKEESQRIVAATLADSPGRILRNAISATTRQFVRVGLDLDVLDPTEDTSRTIRKRIDRLYPGDSVEFRASLQQQGKLYSRLTQLHSLIISAAFWISLIAIVGFSLLLFDPWLRALTGTLVIFLLTNAFICGALSAVHERYQCRVTWPLVVVASVLAVRWWLLAGSRQRDVVLVCPGR